MKKNLQLIFFFFWIINSQSCEKNDMSLDLLHCSMNILFVTILLFGFSNWQIIYSFKGAVTIKAWNLLSLFFPLVLCFVGGSTTITIKKEDGDNNDGDDERGQITQSWELNCLREREREREREIMLKLW